MSEPASPDSGPDPQDFQAEIARLNKIIQALMNRAERSMSVQGTGFGLFQTAILLEEEVHRRTEELKTALRENERINRALQRTQARMEQEIRERKVAEAALQEANQRLQALSILDPLTGLANRRRFTETLQEEWQRAVRRREPVGLAMIDIDFFKKYNDRYGHPAGDRCLRGVGTALKNAVRETDLVARYGGEEFSFVLPGTGNEHARRIAERGRAAVCALNEPHEDSTCGIVTVSIGVSSMMPSAATSPEQLVELADAALYKAKRDGRNRVAALRRE